MMSFTRLTSQKGPKDHQSLTVGYNFPLRTTLIVNPQNMVREEHEEMVMASQYDRNLQIDGLCQNTMDNLNVGVAGKEKIEARERQVLNCSAVAIFLVCLISLISLVLTLLLLTGNISSKCTCVPTSTKGATKPLQTLGFSLRRGEENSGSASDFKMWLLDILRNITDQMDQQSRGLNKLKDDFTLMNKKSIETEKGLKELVEETKKELDFKINTIETTTTEIQLTIVSLNQSCTDQASRQSKTHQGDYYLARLNTTAKHINGRIDRLGQYLFDVEKNMTLKLNLTKEATDSSITRLSVEVDILTLNLSRRVFDHSLLIRNMTMKINQSKQECQTSLSNIQTRLEMAELNLESTKTRLNQTTDKLNKTTHNMEWNFEGVTNDIKKLFSSKKAVEYSIDEIENHVYNITKNLSLQLDSKVNELKTRLNKTTEELYTTTINQRQDLKELEKDTSYKLNVTKNEVRFFVQQISSEVLEMKTNLTKQIKNTKRSIETSHSVFYNYIKNLNETLIIRIGNITKMEGPRGPIGKTGHNGSRGLPGIQGPPSVYGNIRNAANFSQCQYKVQASVGGTKQKTSSANAVVLEPKDKRIVGSTCSTNNAAEYNFKRLINANNDSVYICTCKGQSSLFTNGSRMHCYIHYWECPFI